MERSTEMAERNGVLIDNGQAPRRMKANATVVYYKLHNQLHDETGDCERYGCTPEEA
jgi:predicted component of type VI protein secretion system